MKRHLFFMPVALLCCSFSIEAQQPLVGTIKGVVRDQTKALIAGVALTATNLDSSFTRTTVSGTDGDYQFVNVPPGRYSIMAQKSAYLDFTVALVRVASGETVDMADITMASRGQRAGFDRQTRLGAILETIRAHDAECQVTGSPQILPASARPGVSFPVLGRETDSCDCRPAAGATCFCVPGVLNFQERATAISTSN
jgi:hypothetical protein